MPKRRIKDECLHGLRIELNSKERELVQEAIWVNGAAQAVQGLGSAVQGLGIPLGIIGGVIVWKEGVEWFNNLMEKDKQDFEREVITQANYDAYINVRTEKYNAYVARYMQGVPAENVPSFQEWEAKNYDEPPMLFEQWADSQRASVTQKRRLIASTIFPPLTLLGIGQHGLKDWFTGRK
jgi:hypothetical protein